MHFKEFQNEGIEPELEYKMEQLFGVSVAHEVLRFTLVQCERETFYIPSPIPGLNVSNAPYDCDDEMSEKMLLTAAKLIGNGKKFGMIIAQFLLPLFSTIY